MDRIARRAGTAPRQRAFTLIEVMVVLGILGVLLSASIPAGAAISRSMRLTALSNAFLLQLLLARSEAIKRNGPVALCASPDGLRCAASGGWDQGSIVFHDLDNNGARDAGERVVQRVEGLPDGFRMRGNQNVARYVSYTGMGVTRMVSGAFQAGTVTLCRRSADRTEARRIVINAIGRPRIEKAPVTSCA